MVDSFVSNTADPDHARQLQIDEDLRNAQRLTADFEREFPEDPDAMARTLVQRSLQRPRTDVLYPGLVATKEPDQWLMPLVRRFGWNLARGEVGAAWAHMLAEMVRITVSRVRSVSEQEFVALAEAGEGLLAHRSHGYLGCMAGLACELEKPGPLSCGAVEAIRQLLRLCEPPKGNPDDRERLLWPFFRSGRAFDAADNCWTARVRRDIAGMAPKLSSNWLKAFYKEIRICKAAIKRLGNSQFETGLRRWIGFLREGPEPVLSPDDAMVLRHLITLCELEGGPACDELLYEIARTPWTRKPEHCWMYRYLEVLRNRPQNRAFACLEALMMNPVTATEAVRRQYEGLLAVFGTERAADTPVGVDGFPLDSDPLLTSQHRRLDQLLRMASAAAASGPYVDPGVAAHLEALRSLKEDDLSPARRAALKAWEAQMTRPLSWFPVAPEVTEARKAMESAILEEFSSDPAKLNRAVTTRAEWITTHQHEYSKDVLQLWNEWLHGLGCCDGFVGRSLTKVDELTLASLLGAIKAGGNSTKVFELCQKYVASHGWHADLVEPFRQFIPRLGVPCNQTECARAEWFLWFEDVAPIDVGACWSYRVKKDLRSMPPEEAAAWRALLDNTTFMVTGTPPAKWMKAAEKLFPKVGVERFRRCFVEWFEPFGKGEPLRITITGRNLLRVLMWYTLIAKDDTVDQALLSFANARWKTKQFATRVAQAEMAFSYVLGQRESKAALPILEALVESGRAFEGSTTHGVYQQLCARHNRVPVKAVPQNARQAKEPAPNPILDNMTVGELRNIVQGKLPGLRGVE
jgi:hypothetical protein